MRPSMPNLAYFEVPVYDLKRARKFYQDLLQWEFTKADNPDIPMEYWMIRTGPDEQGSINMGGMHPRMGPAAGILSYVRVDDIDQTLAKVEKMGGKIVNPKTTMQKVGSMAIILDPEGNLIALWEPQL
jgi:predicted enzyme related to lactoylglutathione lyase